MFITVNHKLLIAGNFLNNVIIYACSHVLILIVFIGSRAHRNPGEPRQEGEDGCDIRLFAAVWLLKHRPGVLFGYARVADRQDEWLPGEGWLRAQFRLRSPYESHLRIRWLRVGVAKHAYFKQSVILVPS